MIGGARKRAWLVASFATLLAGCGTTPCAESSCSDASTTFVTTTTTGASGGASGGSTGTGWTAGASGTGGTGGTGGSDGCSKLCSNPLSLPGSWGGPDMLWLGQGEDPVCPLMISNLLEENYFVGPMNAGPLECGGCTCAAPQAACDLSAPWEANADKCINVDASTPKIDFDAKSGWDGKCLSQNGISGGLNCGGVPCVQSITIPRPKVTGSCEPITPEWPKEITWSAIGKVCYGANGFNGCGSGKICLTGPVPGFLMCMAHDDDKECNADWPIKVLTIRTVKDTRGCTPCTCGSPDGDCSVMAAAYSTTACGVHLPKFPFPVKTSDSKDPCLNLPDSTPLASKSMAIQSLTPGSCPPGGGEPTGDVTFGDLVTFCCIPAE